MKNKIIAILSFISLCAAAQDSAFTSRSMYVAAGLSVSNGNNFQASSYPSIEAGAVIGDFGMAAVAGRKDLLFSDRDKSSYFYEAKAFGSRTMKNVTVLCFFGIGNYVSTNYIFIEYGGGISTPINDRVSFGLTYSNWDGTNYVTPSLSYTF